MFKKPTTAAAVLAGLALAALPATAADDKNDNKNAAPPAKTAQKPADDQSSAGSADAGMVVVKDPVTGKLRAPTAEEAAALRSATPSVQRNARLVAAPREFAPRHGGVGRVLDESTSVFAVATKTDGKLNLGEVTGDKAADKAVKQGAPAPKKEEANDR